MKLGVYMHIPFCRRKCDYCGFYSVPLGNDPDRGLIDAYVNRLMAEIDLRSGELRDYTVDTVYFGGGTPSLAQSAHIKALLGKIRERFNCDDVVEATVECNPEDFSPGRIAEYSGYGINRIVLGVQTLNKRLHSLAGRSSRLCGGEILAEFSGIRNIIHCVDLMTAFPGQTPEELLGDLALISKYKFEHISAYILSIEKGTPLAKRLPPEPDLDDPGRRLFETVIDFFQGRGYRHYEVSNFAFPGFESRHNMKYWRLEPYIGFGAAAHSFYGGERYYNPPSLRDYMDNANPLARDERGGSALFVECLMTGMRLLDGISLKELERKSGLKVPEKFMTTLGRLRGRGYIEMENNNDDIWIRFTREGFFLMDSLIFEMAEIVL